MTREKHQVVYKSRPILLNKNKTPADYWAETLKPGRPRNMYFKI